jgi:hypothetical protein
MTDTRITDIEPVAFPFQRFSKNWIGFLPGYNHYVYSDDCHLMSLQRTSTDKNGIKRRLQSRLIKWKDHKLATNADTTLIDGVIYSKAKLYDHMVKVGHIKPAEFIGDNGFPCKYKDKIIVGKLYPDRRNSPYLTQCGNLISSLGILHSDLTWHHKQYSTYYDKSRQVRKVAFYIGDLQKIISKTKLVTLARKRSQLDLEL